MIEISSDSDSDIDQPDRYDELLSSDTDTDSDGGYNGVPGAFFGGYGHCFRCGKNCVLHFY